MSEENAEVTVETTKTTEELQESLRKAEAKIVEMKKSVTPPERKEEEVAEVKTEPTETKGFDDEAFERKYEEKKFFESNPEMSEYKDKILEKTALGISLNEAKLLVENSDETIANRKVASQMNFTDWDASEWVKTYTQEALYELWKKDPALKRRAMEDIASWKAREII